MHLIALFLIAPNWKQPKCSSAGEWLNKLWYIYLHHWLLCSSKKEWAVDKLAATWMGLKRKKPLSKDYILYDVIYITFSKWQNYGMKNRFVAARNQGEGSEWLQGSLLVIEQFCVLIVVVVTQIYICYKVL